MSLTENRSCDLPESAHSYFRCEPGTQGKIGGTRLQKHSQHSILPCRRKEVSMAHYKIVFEPQADMKMIHDVFAAVLHCGKYDSNRVSVSCFFNERNLIDWIFSETGINRIEAAAWHKSDSFANFLGEDYFSKLTAFDIISDDINIRCNGTLTIPVLINWDGIFLNETDLGIAKKRKENTTAEEQRVRTQITRVYQNIFSDLSSLHFCGDWGGSNTEKGTLQLPYRTVFDALPKLMNSLNPKHISAACRIGIDRGSTKLISDEFIERFHRIPQDVCLPGFDRVLQFAYGTPFAINPDGILYPERNCGFEEAFRLAEYARDNLSKFRDFTIFLDYIPWR